MHAIDRARALLEEARDTAIPRHVRGDMRRLSTVMAVAALDTYMHRLVVERCYEHEQLPGGLANLPIPFDQLLAQADEAKSAARNPPHESRPRVAVKRQLRDRLLRETFQRYDEVARALGMAGRGGLWNDIAARMNPATSADELKDRLNGIVDRRNQIVHEGDYLRLERPRNANRNGMSYGKAAQDIDFLSALIDAIHAAL
jgi:RiboL-PSP-HEPN